MDPTHQMPSALAPASVLDPATGAVLVPPPTHPSETPALLPPAELSSQSSEVSDLALLLTEAATLHLSPSQSTQAAALAPPSTEPVDAAGQFPLHIQSPHASHPPTQLAASPVLVPLLGDSVEEAKATITTPKQPPQSQHRQRTFLVPKKALLDLYESNRKLNDAIDRAQEKIKAYVASKQGKVSK